MQHFSHLAGVFLRDGFVHIPDVFSPDEIAELRHATDAVVATAGHGPAGFGEDLKYGELVGNSYGEGNILCRIEYTLAKHPAFVRALGHPVIVAFACAVHGRPFMLTWEDMIIKIPHVGVAVPPHQDLLYQSVNGCVFSVGLYLDDSEEAPLEVIPGSHRLGALDRPALLATSAEREREYVAVPARSGDLLVHNVLAIHRSAQNTSARPRRTLYFEFRSVESVLGDSPWSATWAWRRLHYVAAAVRERRASAARVREDTRHAGTCINARQEYWRFEAEPPAASAIDWRVHHDEIIRRRRVDAQSL